MDTDIQMDADTERDTTASSFIFSRPNIIPSPDQAGNFGVFSENVFGGRSTQLQHPETSTFTFAKPAIIDSIDLTKETNVSPRKVGVRRSSKSSFSPKDIKKSVAFAELEKNSKKSHKDIRLEIANSISCVDVPDPLLVKSVAKEYFEQFGETLKITIRPRRKMITVYYISKDVATTAFYKVGSFLGNEFKVEWTTDEMLNKPKKKESIKGKIASLLNLDDDIREELEALKGLEYNLPEPQNLKTLTAKAKVKKALVVANKDKDVTSRPILKSALKLPSKPKVVEKVVVPKKEIPVVNQNHKKISIGTFQELQNQVRQMGTTAEEKYKILEARDRLMRLKQEKQKDLASAKVTKGSCPDMCPEKERYMREFQRQVSSYEQADGGDYHINHTSAVKQYSRSSADQEEPMAHDLRPVKSLKMTMSYLLHEICDLCENEEANLADWYHFLWDRMRSIRKDITQQELCCLDTVELVEQCARFHILCSERLCAEEVSVFDPKINSENLTKCLQTLKYMYYDLRENEGITCRNEPEFRAYVILLNLNNGTFMAEMRTLPPAVQHSPQVKFALDVHAALTMGNYTKFFKLVRKTTYLNGCILLRYFNQVRVKGLAIMVKAYCRTSGTTEYPLYELIDIFGFEDEDEAFEFCTRVGLRCDRESLYIKLNKENFHQPDSNLEQGRAYSLVLSKRQSVSQSAGQCIAGGVWPDKTYEGHKPHSSFDANGYLLPSSINAQDQNPNLVDPYEFIDEDMAVVDEPKTGKTDGNKVGNNVSEKRQIDAVVRPSTGEFAFKKPDNMLPPASTIVMKPPVAASTVPSIFSTPANATPSVFAARPPAPSIFSSSVPPRPTALPPVTSPFNMTVNKGIFSGAASKTNLFKPPAPLIPSAKAQETGKTMTASTSSSTSTTERPATATKRRLDDETDSTVEKRKNLNLDKDELLRRQQETERKLRAEQEKLRRLERAHELSGQVYEMVESEVVEETCAELVRAELDRLQLIDSLSEKLYDSILSEICTSILDEQLFIQDMLIEVANRLRDRLVLKYYRVWKQWAARRRAQRREALDNTPVWLQPAGIEERARELYHPEQRVAIRFARENKRRSLNSSVEEAKKPRYTPIEFIIGVGLKENAKSFDAEPSQHAFWKMVISWPLLENRLTLWRHKKLVNKYLSPEDYTLEPIFIQHRPTPQERLDICIRHFEGLICENCLTGMDGLLFIVGADENSRSIERRLTKSVLSREKLMPIPLVVLVFGDGATDPGKIKVAPVIERLLESGHVSEYTVLREQSSDEAVVMRAVQSAVLWLAINKSPQVPLEMDHLRRVLDDCITEELWLRIQGYLSRNPQFSQALNDPNFIISLHNEAVNHLTDILLDPESMTYTDFAPELKIYLGSKRSYPCTYEYFDGAWKHSEYRAELERIMSSFVFPKWKYTWPIRDVAELHAAVVGYSRQVVSWESSIAVADNIMSDLLLLPPSSEDDEEEEEQRCYPNFADVVYHLVTRKLSDLGGNTRVVYNKNHIKHFQTLPWWFKSNILLEYAANNVHDEDGQHPLKAQLVQALEIAAMDYESDIDELNETLQQQDEVMPLKDICHETREHVADVQSASKKLERQLEEQRLRSQELEKRLRAALEDDIS